MTEILRPTIQIVGYGKMGHAIEEMARAQGFDIIDAYDLAGACPISGLQRDFVMHGQPGNHVIIEFTGKEGFLDNLQQYVQMNGASLVIGSTGWFKDKETVAEVTNAIEKSNINMIYAGNFSLGVQAYYIGVQAMANALNAFGSFDAYIHEEHHVGKADSPSGTAIEAARAIMAEMPNKTEMLVGNSGGKIKPEQLQITSARFGKVFGTHTAYFEDNNQRLEVTHISQSRGHFAQGALAAAKWITQQPAGKVFTMKDFVNDLLKRQRD